MEWILLAIIAILVIVIVATNHTKEKTNPEQPQQTESKTDYTKCYQRKYLLTKNEWYEYKKLKQFAAELNLQVCPKVRLLDIIEPRKGEKNYKTLLYKIQSKHVDFVICDQDLHIKAIIELDDNSHDQKGRQERDSFVNQILTDVGYKVIHSRGISEDTLKQLQAPAEEKTATQPTSTNE